MSMTGFLSNVSKDIPSTVQGSHSDIRAKQAEAADIPHLAGCAAASMGTQSGLAGIKFACQFSLGGLAEAGSEQ